MKGSLAHRSRPPLIGERPPSPPIPLSVVTGIYTGRREDRSPKRPLLGEETSRWLSSLLIVLVAYAAPLAWWLRSPEVTGVNAPPPAAMVVELAPLPVAPASPSEPPPAPEQPEEPPLPEPEPEPPQVETEAEPVPEVEKAEAVIPAEEESPEEEEPPPPEKPPSAPDALREDNMAAAPDRGAPAPAVSSNRIPDWQNQLMLRLNEAKRYPPRARRYRQEGVTYLRFTMDRSGRVLKKSIDQGSGYRLLDRETLALIERAQPLPKPPVELTGETLEFVVPVEFFLSR